MAKSIGSRIEGRTSHGSMLSLDAILRVLLRAEQSVVAPKPKENTTKGKTMQADCTNVKPSLKNMIDKGERKRRKPST